MKLGAVQNQNGVDITVLPEGASKPVGVQCKLRSELTGSQLSEADVKAIHKKSLRFPGGLSLLVIATTCPPDTSASDMCTKISNKQNKRHRVEPLFWPAIEALLDRHDDVASRFYPEAFSPDRSVHVDRVGHLHISLPVQGWEQRLAQVFSHQVFQAVAGTSITALRVIVAELAGNALDPAKGRASIMRVEIRSDAILLHDDGLVFDSATEPLPPGQHQHGLRAIRRDLTAAKGRLAWTYTAKDPQVSRFNTVRIDIGPPPLGQPPICYSTLSLEFVISRSEASSFVARLAIPAACTSYTVRLALNGVRVVSASASDQILQELVRVMNGRPLTLEVAKTGEDAAELSAWVTHHPNVSIRWL